MKKDKNQDYTQMDALAAGLGMGKLVSKPGCYEYKNVIIDLTACALNELSIMKTACNQVIEKYFEISENAFLN